MADDPRDRAIQHSTLPTVRKEVFDTTPARIISDLINSAKGATEAAMSPGGAWLPSDVPEITDEVIKNTTGFTGDAARQGITKALLSKPSSEVQLGIFAGPRAQGAPIKALHDAFDMKQRGALADDIWRQTGWNELPDKKWMWEISDDLMKLHPNPEGQARFVDDAISHGELVNAYPDMSKTLITRDSPYGQGYSLPPRDSHQGMVSIGPPVEETSAYRAMKDKGPATSSAQSVLLHELQHQLQAREGWVGGSSHELTKKRMMDALKEEMQAGRVKDVLPLADAAKAMDDTQMRGLVHRLYERDLGEMMARATQNRQDLSPLERRLRPPRLDFDMGIENAIVPR